VKASYLLRDYFGLQTDTLHGLQYLAGKTVTKPQTLFTYDQMLRNGYVLTAATASTYLKNGFRRYFS
jgi:hypothetical protein